MSPSKYVRVEQGIARGDAPERIASDCAIPEETVFRVMDYLDALHREPETCNERTARQLRRKFFNTRRKGDPAPAVTP